MEHSGQRLGHGLRGRLNFRDGRSNVVLYAQWTQLPTYTVTYNGNGATGGSVPVDSNKYTSGATVTVLGNSGKSGQHWLHIFRVEHGSQRLGHGLRRRLDFRDGRGNVVLYAQWTRLPTYTVTYSGNGATGGTVPVDQQQVHVWSHSHGTRQHRQSGQHWIHIFRLEYRGQRLGHGLPGGSTFAMGNSNVVLLRAVDAASHLHCHLQQQRGNRRHGARR